MHHKLALRCMDLDSIELFRTDGTVATYKDQTYLVVATTNRSEVEKFAKEVACGRIVRHYNDHTSLWVWRLGKRDEVVRLLRAMTPNLTGRIRKKAQLALEAIDGT